MYFWRFEKVANRISRHKCFEIWYFATKNWFWNFYTYQIWTSISWHVEENMIWPSAGYFFLKSEQRFQTRGQKSLIWDPVMVSMTKTQLTIRQNVQKNKIQKFHFFFQLRFGFICISCYKSLNMGPRPCSPFQEVNLFFII